MIFLKQMKNQLLYPIFACMQISSFREKLESGKYKYFETFKQ